MKLAQVRAHLESTGREVKTIATPAGERLELIEAMEGVARPLAMTPRSLPSGARWLSVSLALGSLERVSLRGALVANGELPVGALGVSGNQLVLCHTLPLDRLQPAQLDHTLAALTRCASSVITAHSTVDEVDGQTPYGYVYR